MTPCCLTEVDFIVEIPDEDELQVSLKSLHISTKRLDTFRRSVFTGFSFNGLIDCY